jgi:hypothetical protein
MLTLLLGVFREADDLLDALFANAAAIVGVVHCKSHRAQTRVNEYLNSVRWQTLLELDVATLDHRCAGLTAMAPGGCILIVDGLIGVGPGGTDRRFAVCAAFGQGVGNKFLERPQIVYQSSLQCLRCI